MHILVTNDDGISAPGLAALANALRPLGQVTIVAPDRNWSACGHVKTLSRPLRVVEAVLSDGSRGLATDGAPSDCVALSLLGLIKDKIDLVVSGINPNANIGHDVTYSGTVTAAMEAVICGTSGIAVSLDGRESLKGELDYSHAAHAVYTFVSQLKEQILSQRFLLNINIPNLPLEQIKGITITRQGTRIYHDELIARIDPQGKSYYWIGGEAPSGIIEDGTDFGALAYGNISITPLQLDLTDYNRFKELKEWNLKL